MKNDVEKNNLIQSINFSLYWLVVTLLFLAILAVFYIPPWKLIDHSMVNLELDKLNEEKSRVEAIITEKCDSPDLQDYKNGRAGPLTGFPDKETPTDGESHFSPKEQGREKSTDVVDLLKGATVRVWSGEMIGSGFFINDHVVVTNRHVIENSKGDDIYVTNKIIGEQPIAVELLDASDSSNPTNPDFALLGVKQNYKSHYILSVSDTPNQLDPVIAAGFPGLTTELDNNKVTPSVVFTRGEVNVLQEQSNGVVLVIHNADIARGSSGGPLVNKCGEVVGVNTFISEGEAVDGRNLYALSGSTLKKFLNISGQKYTSSTIACVSEDKK
jgi:S1-C subfamily serine protease